MTAVLALASAGCTGGGETEPSRDSAPTPSATASASPSTSPSADPSATASPTAPPPSEEDVADIVDAYRAYVAGQVDDLIAATEDVSAAIKKGSPAEARARYPASRRAWGTVRAFADRIDGLVERADGSRWSVPANLAAAEKEWFKQSEAAMWAPGSKASEGAGDGGWRRIEWSIFADKTIKYLSPVADELLKNLEELRTKVPDIQLELADMARDAGDLLEAAGTAVAGTAERYSNADLDGLAGNVEGARKIVELLGPVTDSRPGLTASFADGFDDLKASLEDLEEPDGSGYVPHDDTLTGKQRVAISEAGKALDSLADPLAELQDAVG